MPVEPPPSRWVFPDPEQSPDDLIALGADLKPGTLLAAYRHGLFPMPLSDDTTIGWYSPAARAVLPVDGLRVTRSMRQSRRRFEISMDKAFSDVVSGCADPAREGAWISPAVVAAYQRLHSLGWAHSIEVWHGDELAGGLYGVAVGGLFCGESMFHRQRDASKVALMTLAEVLDDGSPGRLFDVQWSTPHLKSLGVVELGRAAYLTRLTEALELPLPEPWR